MKPPLALVAILALLAMHDLCVAEDAKQFLPQNAKQNSTQIVMEEVQEYTTTPTLESEVDEPTSEAELQRRKHHGSGKHHKKICYYMGKPTPCPEKHEVYGKHETKDEGKSEKDGDRYEEKDDKKDDKHEKKDEYEKKDNKHEKKDEERHHDDKYENKNKYEDKHGSKHHDKRDYEDKPNDKYNDDGGKHGMHDYEDKPYSKPSYEYQKQYDYERDGGYEYYKTTDNYKDRYEYKYDSTFGYDKSNKPYVDGPYEYRSDPYYLGRHQEPGLYYPKHHHQGPGHHTPKGCRGNPTKPDNGAFSCGDTTRVGGVRYATCDNGYTGRPSATCRPDCSWGPVQGSCQPDNVTPANGPAPVIGRALPGLGPPSAVKPFPAQAIPMPGQTRGIFRQADRAPHTLTQCINDPQYTAPTSTQFSDWSKTTCQFYFKSIQNGKYGTCTAWFASRDGNGYMMVTAGHCVVNERRPGSYMIDPNFQDMQVCCREDRTTGLCTEGLFQVDAWATTRGFYTTGLENDGAVLWVEQVSQDRHGNNVPQITPVLQEIVYHPPNANLPTTILFSDGYPGNATDDQGNVEDEGCTFSTGWELWFWNTTTPLAPVNTNTQQGRDVSYEVAGCEGHSGGRLLNVDGKAFAILVRGPSWCTATGSDAITNVPVTNNGHTRTTFTQIVNYPSQYGADIVALQRAVRGSVRGLQWVTPVSGRSCKDACLDLSPLGDLGGGWRPINGGSNNSALCAEVIQVPITANTQWLSGRTIPDQPVQCNLTLPSGASQTASPAVKCACTNCLGKDCEFEFWLPKDQAANCPLPKIDGTNYFYKPICRSDAPPSNIGWTGWVDTSTCEGYQFSNPDYSVWCPEGLLACGGAPVRFEYTASTNNYNWTRIISTGPISRLELRWDMYENVDRLQIFDHSSGSRGMRLLDTGFVGTEFNGCPPTDPINPPVFVLPQPFLPGVCASRGGCLGLLSDTEAGCETMPPCVTSGFSVSQIEVVVTSACRGSAWRLQLDCA